jgi:hypothetical protein
VATLLAEAPTAQWPSPSSVDSSGGSWDGLGRAVPMRLGTYLLATLVTTGVIWLSGFWSR